MRIRATALAIAGAVAACAPTSQMPSIDPALARAEAEKQRELALTDRVAELARLRRVADPLLVAGADLCHDRVAWRIGLALATRDDFAGDYREAAEKALGLDAKLRALVVVPDGPAARAGVRRGDALVTLHDWTVPTGRGAKKAFEEHLKETLKTSETGAVQLAIKRDSETHTFDLAAKKACDFDVRVVVDDKVNAFADGDSINVDTGMMRFADTDVALATVVGHEMAHDLMGHIDKQRGNAAIGMLFDLLLAGMGANDNGAFAKMGAKAFSQEFEAEADYVGLYIEARAHLPIAKAPDFWRRMAAAHPGNIKGSFQSDHPATPERFLALEKTVAEIEANEAKGEPLIPNAKPEPARPILPDSDGATLNP